MPKRLNFTPQSDKDKKNKQTPKERAESLGMIVSALEYLKEEAKQSGVEEVEVVIDSTFKICMTIYYMFLRGDYIEKYKE